MPTYKTVTDDPIYRVELAYNANNQIEYMGIALPNILTSEDKWRIIKYIYEGPLVNGKNLLSSIRFAGGTYAMNKVWDNRTSYTY